VANGVDVIKIVSADGPETLGEWTTVQTTAEEANACFSEARRLGRITASHAMGPEAIGNVCRAGVDTVEHGWYLSEESCAIALEHGTRFVPTLGNVVAIIHDGPKYEMPWAEMMAADEQAIFERYAMAVEMGVPIAMGSDCGGNEAHRHGNNAMELECYVRCGMSPLDAIGSATLEAAKVLRLDSEIGSIAEGKVADLVVIDGNPLDDISLTRTNVIGVVQAGTVRRDDLGLLDVLKRPAAVTR
jgi:imidazolonepropionase-like amidohydrolase